MYQTNNKKISQSRCSNQFLCDSVGTFHLHQTHEVVCCIPWNGSNIFRRCYCGTKVLAFQSKNHNGFYCHKGIEGGIRKAKKSLLWFQRFLDQTLDSGEVLESRLFSSMRHNALETALFMPSMYQMSLVSCRINQVDGFLLVIDGLQWSLARRPFLELRVR